MKLVCASSLLLALAGISSADIGIVGIADFTADATESFDSFSPGLQGTTAVEWGLILSNAAVTYPSSPGVEFAGKSGNAAGTGAGMGGSAPTFANRTVVFQFAEPIDRFGGSWQSDGFDLGFGLVTESIELTFFAVGGEFTTVSLTPNNSTTLQFFGFQSAVPIDRIELVDASGGQTAKAWDDLKVRYAPVPEPASMAVLGLGLAALKRRRKNG